MLHTNHTITGSSLTQFINDLFALLIDTKRDNVGFFLTIYHFNLTQNHSGIQNVLCMIHFLRFCVCTVRIMICNNSGSRVHVQKFIFVSHRCLDFQLQTRTGYSCFCIKLNFHFNLRLPVHPRFWKSVTYHVLTFKRIPEVAPILEFTSK